MVLIGARILEYRKAANMSQEEFAAKIGVSRQAVSKWELDKAYPDLDKLMDICEMFGVSIDELIRGREVLVSDHSATQDELESKDNNETEKKPVIQRINMTSLKKMRGGAGTWRLSICAMLAGMLFLFCCTVFIMVLSNNEWDKNNEHVANARVERVYQQYTKADISFTDEEYRKVLETVWLDMDGIRDGDYIECYTDADQQSIYLDYYVPTLAVPGILMLLFFCILILLCMEIRRVRKENKWHILVEDESEKESRVYDE